METIRIDLDHAPTQEAPLFTEMGLSTEILRAIGKMGFIRPTPIQAAVIPHALKGHDILGGSETGSGKTAAFLIPVLEDLLAHPGRRVLILEPTRELALQIQEVATSIACHTKFRAVAVFGGIKAGSQAAAVRNGVELVIATPGRLFDLTWMGVVDYSTFKHFIVDEVDRMFDMGFIDDVKKILSFFPETPFRKMGFSATLSREVLDLFGPIMSDPVYVVVGRASKPAEGITHKLYNVRRENKLEALLEVLEGWRTTPTIIFCETKIGADRLFRSLRDMRLDVKPFHSGYDQVQRYDILKRFRDKKLRLLVATNVAARGLDITGIDLIVNYDVPRSPEDYVHRIGRSARMDAKGTAVTFATPEEARQVVRIEQLIQMKLPRETLSGATRERPVERRPVERSRREEVRPVERPTARRPVERPHRAEVRPVQRPVERRTAERPRRDVDRSRPRRR